MTYVENQYSAWRILTNTTLIPTVPLLVMIYLMPESPRYLMKHGRYREALDAFTQIQTTLLLAARDFIYAHAQLDFESRMFKGRVDEPSNLADRVYASELDIAGGATGLPQGPGADEDASQHVSPRQSVGDPASGAVQRRSSTASTLDNNEGIRLAKKRLAKEENPYSYHIGVTGYYRRLGQLWSNMRCRRALLAASIAMISQQMTGVNTIAFLGTIVWSKSFGDAPTKPLDRAKEKNNAETAAIIGLAFGAANYLGGLPAYWLSDRIGRSIMLALGFPNMAWSMLVFAFLFKISDTSVQIPLVSIFAVVFVLFYAPTAGTSPFVSMLPMIQVGAC